MSTDTDVSAPILTRDHASALVGRTMALVGRTAGRGPGAVPGARWGLSAAPSCTASPAEEADMTTMVIRSGTRRSTTAAELVDFAPDADIAFPAHRYGSPTAPSRRARRRTFTIRPTCRVAAPRQVGPGVESPLFRRAPFTARRSVG
jgi:hypothetical protein